MIELELLNAIIASRDATALVRHGLMEEKQWLTHQEAYKFIKNHVEEYGELPSVSSVIQNTDNFEAVTTAESVETLAKKMVERNLKKAQRDFLVASASDFDKIDAYEMLEKMEQKIEEFRKATSKKTNNGIDWSVSGADRLAEFERRKSREFSRRVPFFFEELTEALGDMNGGFYLTIMAFTSKGKTWLGLLEALRANREGLPVLIESGEMSKPEILFRLDTLAGGFNNRGLVTGSLDFREEESYQQWLEQFHRENGKPILVIKSQEDWKRGLTVAQIEHDIQVHKPAVMIIDQFSLIRHASAERTSMADSSRRIKELAGKYGIVICMLYQANGEYIKSKGKKGKESKNEDGIKELVPPDLSNYSDSISVIQDSDCVLTFDSTTWRDKQTGRQHGKALLYVAKSRAGGEGMELEMHWVPNDGVIETKKATDIF